MNIFNKLDKINYYAAFSLVVVSIIYCERTAQQSITYNDYTFAPIMVTLLVCVITYILFTIVKSNNLFEYVIGIVMFIILSSYIPIIGEFFDPDGTTVQYYTLISNVILIGILYITAYNVVKSVAVLKVAQ